ncbi:MAG: hypothetical protein ABJZ55_00495 [Fuerstiella sp.]
MNFHSLAKPSKQNESGHMEDANLDRNSAAIDRRQNNANALTHDEQYSCHATYSWLINNHCRITT